MEFLLLNAVRNVVATKNSILQSLTKVSNGQAHLKWQAAPNRAMPACQTHVCAAEKHHPVS